MLKENLNTKPNANVVIYELGGKYQVGTNYNHSSFEDITLKKQKGITLVALVITIVVLLILAGVATAELKNGGIITQGKAATKKYSEAEELEKVKLAAYDALVEENGEVTYENLDKALKRYFKDDYEFYGGKLELLGKVVNSVKVADKKLENSINGNYHMKIEGIPELIHWTIKIKSSGRIYLVYYDGKVEFAGDEDDYQPKNMLEQNNQGEQGEL